MHRPIAEQHSALAPVGVPYIHEEPLKAPGSERIASGLLEIQGQQAASCLVAVDYSSVHGTCMDERGRLSLMNGQPVEPRPSAPGGPNIYALAVAELTGLYDNQPDLDGEQRLHDVSDRLTAGNLKGGGHDTCKANADFLAWMKIIADNGEELKADVKKQRGDSYDEEAADYVIGKARDLVESGVFEGWEESTLTRVLGDDAGKAMENTYKVPHQGVTFIRNKVKNATIDQTALYGISVVGEGSFVVDDPYVDTIEHILTAGPDAVEKKKQAEHAREFIIAALVRALPNEEMYRIDIVPS